MKFAIINGREHVQPELLGEVSKFDFRVFSDGAQGTSENVGSRATLWRAFRGVLAVWPSEEWFTFLEDDVVPCRNAFAAMPRLVPLADLPGWLWVSWYAVDGDPEDGSGWRVAEGGTFRRAQAFTLHRSLVERALSTPVPGGDNLRNLGDVALSMALATEPYVTVYPSLVQHVGAVSIANPTGESLGGTSPTYPGDDFDALTLL